MYYFHVVLSTVILSLGLILLKRPFFPFSLATASLLNTMLESRLSDEEKQKQLIARLGRMLGRFGIMLLSLALLVGISISPVWIYMEAKDLSMDQIDRASWTFYLCMLGGSLVLFLPAIFRKKKEYSDWSILLHRLLLDNYNISRALFALEKRFFKKRLRSGAKGSVIVTGLARAGTTALTNLLHGCGKFHSLSYDNMPFLLAPNIWRKFYRPRKGKKKDRAHGDRVKIGYDSVEALEEFFFKAALNDSYIREDRLIEHEIDEKTMAAYSAYRKLIRPKGKDTVYLAKNNNFMLRYRSMRAQEAEMRVVLLFRNPVDHALSLERQHRNFCEQQAADPFVREYMDWLGHHEFGLGHKPFVFASGKLPEPGDPAKRDHWLATWVAYYGYILSLDADEKLVLVGYADLLHRPTELMQKLGAAIDVDLSGVETTAFEGTKYERPDFDPELLREAERIYAELQSRKLGLSASDPE